jgi:hypothetical protein
VKFWDSENPIGITVSRHQRRDTRQQAHTISAGICTFALRYKIAPQIGCECVLLEREYFCEKKWSEPLN